MINFSAYPFAGGTGSDYDNSSIAWSSPLGTLLNNGNLTDTESWESSNVYATYVGGKFLGSKLSTWTLSGVLTQENIISQKINLRLFRNPNTQTSLGLTRTDRCFDVWGGNRYNGEYPFLKLYQRGGGSLLDQTPVIKFNPNNFMWCPYLICASINPNGSYQGPIVSIYTLSALQSSYPQIMDTGCFTDDSISIAIIGTVLAPFIGTETARNEDYAKYFIESELVYPTDWISQNILQSLPGLIYGVADNFTYIGNAADSWVRNSTIGNNYITVTFDINAGYAISSGPRAYSTYTDNGFMDGGNHTGLVMIWHQPGSKFTGSFCEEDIPLYDLCTNRELYQAKKFYKFGNVVALPQNGTLIRLYDCLTKSDIEHIVSTFGMWWSWYPSKCRSGIIGENCTDSDIHLGKMYSDGTTDGTYTSGVASANEIQSTMTDLVADSPVIPVIPGTPITPIDPDIDDTFPHDRATGDSILQGYGDIVLAGRSATTLTAFGSSGLLSMLSALSNADVTFWSALGKPLLGSSGADAVDLIIQADSGSLLNYICACRIYPFNAVQAVRNLNATVTASTTLTFGYRGANIPVSNIVLGSTAGLISMGTASIRPLQQAITGFWDYEPYTTVSVTLPGIGTFPLDCARTMGNTITCDYIIDFTTGIATANLYTDINNVTVPLLCKSGQIGIDISIAGNDILTQAQNIANAQLNNIQLVTGMAGDIASVAAGNFSAGIGLASTFSTGVLSATINTSMASRDVPNLVTSSGGLGSIVVSQQAYLTVRRPYIDMPRNYGHNFGYLIEQSYTIADLSGYTICTNVDTSGISATAEERAEIKRILETGFYA